MTTRVLLIDDDDVAREFLGTLLRQAGYEVHELPSPIGATRVLLNKNIDIVVLDVFMPQMDGDKSAKVLRDNPRLQGIRIVLVSSCEESQLEEISARVQADAVVPKAEARLRLVPTVDRLRRAQQGATNPAPSRRAPSPRKEPRNGEP
jgi:CheY-like chemotaxis protein